MESAWTDKLGNPADDGRENGGQETYTSLGNYQHQSSTGTIEVHDTESGICSKCNQEVLAPGLYKTDGTMTKSWSQLLADGDLIVENGTLKGGIMIAYDKIHEETYYTNIEGKLVIDSSVTILGNVPEIGEMTFEHCYNLTSVTLSKNLTAISDNAFRDCTSLTSITMPNSETCIQVKTFYNCKKLTSIDYNGTKSQWNNIELMSSNSNSVWNYGCPQITVHCTDGDIVIPTNN